MRLLVDIGNSRVKWARETGDGVRLTGHGFPTALGTLAADLDRAWRDLERPGSVRVCNVAGAGIESVLNTWVSERWQLTPAWIRSAAQARGLVNAYADPSRLGADRWVGMIGAQALFGWPLCLVSLGTALTVDLVDTGGRHRGGLIAPGLGLMRGSVLQRTEGVRPEADVDRSAFWGRNSGACLESGIVQMTIALIERAVHQARQDLCAEPTVVLTGGDADVIAPRLSIPHERVPDLVLEGLARCEG